MTPPMRRVLFVDDEPHVLESLRDALRPRRREWSMRFETSGAAALEALEEAPYDVVVSDMRMPGMDGAELLGLVHRRHPNTVRVVLSGYAELEIVARAAAVAHRFLAKPCDLQELVRVIERSCALVELTDREALRRVATSATRLPCVPETYARLQALLEDGDSSIRDAAAIVKQDVAMAAKVLQLANSAFFGRSRAVPSIVEAVSFLGLSTLKALTLTAGALEAFRPERPIEHFSLDEVQRHGTLVARLARRLLPDGAGQDASFTAALLHDVGLVVLAAEEPGFLGDILATAHRDRRPVSDVELETRGITHGEVGAHLLDLWGLPHEIVEAVAYHHRPEAIHEPMLDPVAAVHVADALVGERLEGPDGTTLLDCDYLERLGVADRLPHWRELAATECEAA